MYVYPNPVNNGAIGLQMGKAAAGKYSITLRNTTGQLVMNKQILHIAGAAEQINYSAEIAAGTYQLEVVGADKKKTSMSVVIVKQ